MTGLSNPGERWAHAWLFWLGLFILLLPWLAFLFGLPINGDNAALTAELTRILHGGRMSDVAFEENTPFSLFTLGPAVLLARTGLPLDHSVNVVALLALIASAAATWRLLSGFAMFEKPAIAVMVAGFVVSQTLPGAGTSFNERDQLIALGLVPLTLAQIMLTLRRPWPRYTGPAATVIGALLILVKPQYVVLPAFFLLHRAITRRRWQTLRDPDISILASVAVAGILVLTTAFSDWLPIVATDAMALYRPAYPRALWVAALVLTAITCLALVLFRWRWPKTDERRALILLTCASVVALVPFILQGKGFFYHLFPAFGFLGLVSGALAYHALTRNTPTPRAAFAALVFLTGFGYAVSPPEAGMIPGRAKSAGHFPTRADYRAAAPVRLADTCMANGHACPIFIYAPDIGVIQQTAYYAGAPVASRFPDFWFLPALTRPGTPQSPFFHVFAGMVAADFDQWTPPIALIESDTPVDFVGYFGTDPAFAGAFRPYRKSGSMTIGYPYAAEARTFDIYRRQAAP